jgi:uncharacterized protein (DUF302 family)
MAEKYYINTIFKGSFDEAIEKVTAELQKEQFGIPAQLDITGTLKEKLGVDFRKYRVLGACNPPSAHKALQIEDKVGTMLPCNVVVQELEPGKVEIAAVNPVASMLAIENPALKEIINDVKSKLERVIAAC